MVTVLTLTQPFFPTNATSIKNIDKPTVSSCSSFDSRYHYVATSTSLVKSIDYGHTWQSTNASTFSSFMKIVCDSRCYHALIASSFGEIQYSNNNTGIWYQSDGPTNKMWRYLAMAGNGNYAVAISTDGLYVSSDNGVTWSMKMKLDGAINPMVVVDYTGQHMVLILDNGNIWNSDSWGLRWKSTMFYLPCPVLCPWMGIAASADLSTIIIVAENGESWISRDSSMTWTELFDGVKRPWSSVSCNIDCSKIVLTTRRGEVINGRFQHPLYQPNENGQVDRHFNSSYSFDPRTGIAWSIITLFETSADISLNNHVIASSISQSWDGRYTTVVSHLGNIVFMSDFTAIPSNRTFAYHNEFISKVNTFDMAPLHNEQFRFMVDIVVARYNEDLLWLVKLVSERLDMTKCRVFVYNKGLNSTTLPPELGSGEPWKTLLLKAGRGNVYWIDLPNIGREGHTYLKHIIERVRPCTMCPSGVHQWINGLNGDSTDERCVVEKDNIDECDHVYRPMDSFIFLQGDPMPHLILDKKIAAPSPWISLVRLIDDTISHMMQYYKLNEGCDAITNIGGERLIFSEDHQDNINKYLFQPGAGQVHVITEGEFYDFETGIANAKFALAHPLELAYFTERLDRLGRLFDYSNRKSYYEQHFLHMSYLNHGIDIKGQLKRYSEELQMLYKEEGIVTFYDAAELLLESPYDNLRRDVSGAMIMIAILGEFEMIDYVREYIEANYWRFIAGACFATNVNAIHLQPLPIYQELLDSLSHSIHPRAGFAVERLWGLILDYRFVKVRDDYLL